MFSCYVATLCFCGGRKIQVRYIVCYKHNHLFFRRCRGEKCAVLLAWLQTDFSNVVAENNQTYLLRMLASVKRLWYIKLKQSFFEREKGGVLVSFTPLSRVNLIHGAKRLFVKRFEVSSCCSK